MKSKTFFGRLAVCFLIVLITCSDLLSVPGVQAAMAGPEMAQVPSWSKSDLNFFLHGSMSTEVVPENVLRAFIRTYPDLFPKEDLSNLGLIPDPEFGWPVGFSRAKVPHLGGLSAIGVNCAACHVSEFTASAGAKPVRVLGVSSLFDAESYFGVVTVAGFRTEAPANMKKFLAAYLAVNDPSAGEKAQQLLADAWSRQEAKITAAMSADPSGAKGLPAGTLQPITGAELQFDHKMLAHDPDLTATAHSFLKLFHNMRASLHIPDPPPEKAPPVSGPGRNDAFGLLSLALFGVPQPFAPVKFGLVWNLDQRAYVHWDGNTSSPLGRNLLASLGLGAPLMGKHSDLNFRLVKKQTDLSERIRPPRYPWAVDESAAKRGAAHYEARCASCHNGPETDARLHAYTEVGTSPTRAQYFTAAQADNFNKFLGGLEIQDYEPFAKPAIRGTQKYWAPSLGGVWARAPYLHNGSVRTMQDLLAPAAQRAKDFHRGTRVYDTEHMGYADEGAFVMDTSTTENANIGHEYGTDLSGEQKHELIEYLKTL